LTASKSYGDLESTYVTTVAGVGAKVDLNQLDLSLNVELRRWLRVDDNWDLLAIDNEGGVMAGNDGMLEGLGHDIVVVEVVLELFENVLERLVLTEVPKHAIVVSGGMGALLELFQVGDRVF
jgi:hypothetical protein